jgi:hypothetical protein
MLVFGLRTSISAAIGLNFAKRLQPISRRAGRNRQQTVLACLDADKKEFETHDTVNESKGTIKCLRIRNLRGYSRPRPEMSEIRCRGVLFDLDGVLIDSTPALTRVWRQWALEHGFDPEEVVARVHGRPSLATVREYLPNADHAAENREIERRETQDADGINNRSRSARIAAAASGETLDARDFMPAAAGRSPTARGGFTGSRADRDLYRCDPGQAASRTISEGRCKVGLYRPGVRCRGRCSRGDPSRQGGGGKSHRFPYHRRRGRATARGCRFYLA